MSGGRENEVWRDTTIHNHTQPYTKYRFAVIAAGEGLSSVVGWWSRRGWARVFGGWRGSAEDQEDRDDVAVL